MATTDNDILKIVLNELFAEVHHAFHRSEQNNKERFNTIMSAISDYAAKVDAAFTQIGTDVDTVVDGVTAISTSVTGIDKDVADLKALILKLQNSPGTITPEDQATLDALDAKVATVATKTAALAASTSALKTTVAALDAQTEDGQTPVPPTT